MVHVCTIENDLSATNNIKWYQKVRLISHDNPLRLKYFRSDVSVREEQDRHLKMKECTIHPFSKLKARYDIYLIYLYTSLIITKPFDAGFLKTHRSGYFTYKCYSIFTDVLGCIDIVMSFFTGYALAKYKNTELRMSVISKHYVFGPFFVFDVLSSVNKQANGIFPTQYGRFATGVIVIMNLTKIVRLWTLIKCICTTAAYYRISARGKLFLGCSIFVSLIIVHYMACLQFTVPKLVRRTFVVDHRNVSWFFGTNDIGNIYKQGMGTQYIHCFFRSSAYILGIPLNLYGINLPEEYLLVVFTYFIGKILIAFVWVILAVAILNSRLIDIKFKELFNQLEEYMIQKQLPLGIRSRIFQFFMFKYRHKYFKEELITSLLSEDLKNEANLHVCKTLIRNVPLFSELKSGEVSRVVQYLVQEIYLPHDVIIRAGTFTDGMYFINSGTVAVYTNSGREICHMQDGAYFGEIPLLIKGQRRVATVRALEETQVFKLKRKDMERCLLTNKIVKQKIIKRAERRLREITLLDEEYKHMLFGEKFRSNSKLN